MASLSSSSSSSALAASTAVAAPASSWKELRSLSSTQKVGGSLEEESQRRVKGKGSAHVHSTLRLFDQPSDEKPKITLFRDHAGWCPYCQKTVMLVEEKGIPINIELVNMRSYGDKPREFLAMIPGGLLPALTVDTSEGRKVITESAVIMELLDRWHPPSEGYKPMLPADDDEEGLARYDKLARLERQLFSWWCTLVFRPEGPRSVIPSASNLLGMLSGKSSESESMSSSMSGFLDCLATVDAELTSTPGPWFFGQYDHPTMIDFVYVSHVERMLASCAYWKGMDIRSRFAGINAWLEAFEKREAYLAFKSDFYTHVKDIPPQYGPGWDGGWKDERERMSSLILGKDGESWNLPLPYDDPLQPLYNGLPLPLCVLEAAGITPDEGSEGTYHKVDPNLMAQTCRHMAGWKLASNGEAVGKFASRGGPEGAKNPRKGFGAELADPYAEFDESIQPQVDAVLRMICQGMLESVSETQELHVAHLNEEVAPLLVPFQKVSGVVESLAYLRDRVGVPRDLPLAAARQLRAHLNWAIDVLK